MSILSKSNSQQVSIPYLTLLNHAYTESENLSIVAYLSHGKDLFSDDENFFLETLSEKYNVSVRSIILNWIISKKNLIVLTSSMSKEHTKQCWTHRGQWL